MIHTSSIDDDGKIHKSGDCCGGNNLA